MHNASVYIGLMIPYNAKTIQGRISRMNHNRKISLFRKLNHGNEAFLLHCGLRVKVLKNFFPSFFLLLILLFFDRTSLIQSIVIQTNLSDCNYTLGITQLFQLLERIRIEFIGILRVKAHSAIDRKACSPIFFG